MSQQQDDKLRNDGRPNREWHQMANGKWASVTRCRGAARQAALKVIHKRNGEILAQNSRRSTVYGW